VREMKKEQPVITYTEILSRAAGSIERDIAEWQDKAKGLQGAENMLGQYVDGLRKKLDAINTMYRIETGSDL
jgi:hypothetical protein